MRNKKMSLEEYEGIIFGINFDSRECKINLL